MRKFICALLLSFISTLAFSQTKGEKVKCSDTLIMVKNILEKYLVGTNIRDLRTSFTIDKIQSSNHYEIKGDIINILPSSQLRLLNHKLNKTLKKHTDLRLDGDINFDRYLDTTIVSVAYQKKDTIFTFHPIAIPLNPRESYPNFSKELHDVIKLKFKEGKIAKDSVLSTNHISFKVDFSGRITRTDEDAFKNELDSFFNEKRWKRSSSSSNFIEAQVKFGLNQGYLIKDDHWSKPHIKSNGNDYGDGWANLDLITPFDIGSQTTCFSYQKPNRTWDYKSLISIVYDQVLNKFRMPIVHFGNQEQTKQLIEDLNSIPISNRDFYTFYNRIYFYRLK